MRFRRRRIVPPGNRYFYRVPETGTDFSRPTMGGLLAALRTHYNANALPVPPDLEALVEHHMCGRLPEGFCEGDGERTVRAVSLHDIRRNTEAERTATLVPMAEAQVRADACLRCPRNDTRLCPVCVGLTAWALRLVGRRKVARVEYLGVCEVTATALAATVNYDSPKGGGEFPEGCWRRA